MLFGTGVVSRAKPVLLEGSLQRLVRGNEVEEEGWVVIDGVVYE